jgi:hypothetical protein
MALHDKNIVIEVDLGFESIQCLLLESDSPCLLQDITIKECHMLLSVPNYKQHLS